MRSCERTYVRWKAVSMRNVWLMLIDVRSRLGLILCRAFVASFEARGDRTAALVAFSPFLDARRWRRDLFASLTCAWRRPAKYMLVGDFKRYGRAHGAYRVALSLHDREASVEHGNVLFVSGLPACQLEATRQPSERRKDVNELAAVNRFAAQAVPRGVVVVCDVCHRNFLSLLEFVRRKKGYFIGIGSRPNQANMTTISVATRERPERAAIASR